MDIERLTARNKNGLAYLVNVKPNEQEVDSPHKNTLKCILDCFERLAQYEEEAIARQSVKSEEVAEAIEVINKKIYAHKEFIRQAKITNMAINLLPHYVKIKSLDLAISALQAYQPWIPVSERLPKNSEHDWVLAQITEDNGYMWIPKVVEYRERIGDWYCEELGWLKTHNGTFKVTHWKPLPKPPKGE